MSQIELFEKHFNNIIDLYLLKSKEERIAEPFVCLLCGLAMKEEKRFVHSCLER